MNEALPKDGTVLARLQRILSAPVVGGIVRSFTRAEIEEIDPDVFVKIAKSSDESSLKNLSADDWKFRASVYTAPDCDHRRGVPMEIGRVQKSPSVLAAVSAISLELQAIKTEKKLSPNLLELSLNLVLSNLAYVRFSRNGWMCMYFSRSNSRYKKGRYNPKGIGITPFRYVVNGLLELGYIVQLIGSTRRRSRMRATPKLAVLLEDKFGITLDDVLFANPGELIQLKNKDDAEDEIAQLVDYPDTTETKRMRKQLVRYNELIASTKVSLPEKAAAGIDLNSKTCRRIFVRGSFDLNGRYYGAWWSNAKRAIRNQILINGEETVSLDFKAMNPHLIYSLVGVPYSSVYTDGDPYFLEGYDAESRDARKFCFLIALNSDSRTQALRAIPYRAREKGVWLGDLNVGKTLDDFNAKHTLIKDWIHTDSALKLAYQESQVTETILEILTEQGIPALNVHDEYIVGMQNEDFVKQVMVQSFEHHGLLSIPPIKSE